MITLSGYRSHVFYPKLAALILSKAGCTDFIQSWLHSAMNK